MPKMIIAEIGNCVHAAGIYNFNRLATQEGFDTAYLGSAIPITELIGAITEYNPDVVAIGYRLSNDTLKNLLDELALFVKKDSTERLYVFGGTLDTALMAKNYSFIEKIFNGEESEEDVLMFLRRGLAAEDEIIDYPQTLKERRAFKGDMPLFRHHLGLESVERTAEDIKRLAESGLLDVISIATDQNAQEFYYEQEKMNKKLDGAGGVPVRNEEHLKTLYEASRTGNHPLVRCYSGTNHLLPFSQVLQKTIHNAWAAIPVTWYSALDRRSTRDLLTAIKENMEAIAWNGAQGIPVESNESHQWALRYCNDAVEVATSYMVAAIAKGLGVKEYISQLMLATPPTISPQMDLAKMMAKNELIETLIDDQFTVYRMMRTGLLAYPADLDEAKGLLSSTMFYGTYLKPDIAHVVSYCEARNVATADEIIESVKMVKKAFKIARMGMPDISGDKVLRARIDVLKKEAMLLIDTMNSLSNDPNPLLNPQVIYDSIRLGILDAPGLQGFSVAKGKFRTEIVNGYHVSVDERGKVLTEKERLQRLGFYR